MLNIIIRVKNMKKLTVTALIVMALACIFCISAAAAAPVPTRPTFDVEFDSIASTIDGFEAPSELYVNTDERVLLTDGEGGYVTYPTYYVTKNSATFDFDFSKLNAAQSIQYSKKSVVMVEIPDGITTISNSYFAGTGNFPICVFVQFPGSVTSYGSSLFASYNSVIRAVEFLDGETPITMGDGMFGSQHNGGTTNLEYVKFPNNLTSIGNNTFGKSHQNKTIILGENLEKIGTSFFGESTPSGKDTFVYCSSKFFANPDDMFKNLFGGFDQWHNNYLRVTLFYTGTEAEANELVANGLKIQTGYMWDANKAVVVSASEYDYATHKPTQNADITIVYGYNKCDAFYYGVHNNQVLNGCQFGCVNGCGVAEMLENPQHEYENVVTYGGACAVDYYKSINVIETCKTCQYENASWDIDPLFTDKGYSVDLVNVGISQCFVINDEAIALYKQYVDAGFEYGVVASINDENPLVLENGEVKTVDKAISFGMSDTDFTIFNVKVVGIPEDYATASITGCAYTLDRGKIYYLSENQTTTKAIGASYEALKSQD